MVEYTRFGKSSRSLQMSFIGDKKKKQNSECANTGRLRSADLDLQPMPPKTSDLDSSGPFLHSQESDDDATREFDCSNYDSCLSTSAALNWHDFTCSSCDGTINESLLSLAKSAAYFDPLLNHLGVKRSNGSPTISGTKSSLSGKSQMSREGKDRKSLHRVALRLLSKNGTTD
jgi:hypothetical protein